MPLPAHNPALPFILPGWTGNPQNAQGQYLNLDGPSERSFAELLKWQTAPKPLKALKKNQQPGIEVIMHPGLTGNTDNGITWLGHATFIFTLHGRQLITDPVFHNLSILKRHTPLPMHVADLKGIDYILLSHNHRDHCDKKSLQQITALNPSATILTGLAIAPLLRSWKISNPIVEAGWYQRYALEEDFSITYLPAKHWNRRALTDTNQMLWGSMMIESKAAKIYFGADSGLGSHFRQIGEMYPGIDYALLGIGAYMPEWFMHTAHTSPADVLVAMRDLQAKQLIPMHHGTFDLSDEPVFYPKQELIRLAEAQNMNQVLHAAIGHKIYF
jgi:L-ascorbate metabolism protein UlaG (beta-lactamase superfamily)